MPSIPEAPRPDGFQGPPQPPQPAYAPPYAPPPSFSSPPPAFAPPGGQAAYRDGKGLATAIAVLLPIYLLVNIVQAAVPPAVNATATGGRQGVFYSFSSGILGFLSLGCLVALAVVTPLWLARTHRNTEALTGAPVGTSAGWTAAAWFIPVVGGFLVAGPLGKLWSRGPGAPGGGKALPLSWAILWSLSQAMSVIIFVIAIGSFFSKAVSKASAGSTLSPEESQRIAADLARTIWPFEIVHALVLVGAGVCMWLAVRRWQSWQSQAAQAARFRPQPQL